MNEEFIRKIIFIILIVLGLKLAVDHFRDPTVYRGPHYQVKIPEGWIMKKQEDEVVFSHPDNDLWTGIPEAMISVYGKKIDGALFLDDLFMEVQAQLKMENGAIIDKGEIMIDNVVSKWVLFHNKEPSLAVLTFFIVDDYNRLTRIQYVTPSKKFNTHRPVFEDFKASLTFKGPL